jgi:hypothetical protein
MRQWILVLCSMLIACKADSKPAQAPAAAEELAKPSPPPAPVQGTRVRIAGVGGVDPFEITLPAGFTHTIDNRGDEQPPAATIAGPGLKFVIELPEAGFFKLDEEKAIILRGDPKIVFDRAEAAADGWNLIYKQGPGNGPNSPYAYKYAAVVSRPGLALQCSSFELDTKEAAEQLVALCGSIQASPDKGSPAAPRRDKR